MLILSNKLKKVFCNKRQINENRLIIDPELIAIHESFDEDIDNTSPYKEYEILIRIPIDKKAAIKNKAAYFDGYFSKDIDMISKKDTTFVGFDTGDSAAANFAIFHSEDLARQSQRDKEKAADLIHLFDADVATTMLSGIKEQDFVSNKNMEAIFGIDETIVVKSQKVSDRKNNSSAGHVALSNKLKNTNTFSPLASINEKRRLALSENAITQKNFKNTYIKSRRTGLDPAYLISRSRYNSQSLAQSIKGHVNKNFASNKSLEDNLGNDFHRMIDFEIGKSPVEYEIEKIKRIKLHDTIEKKVKITQSLFENTQSASRNIGIVVYAKTSKKRKIDYYIIKLDLQKMISNYKKVNAIKQFQKYSFASARSNNKITAEIKNNSNSKMLCSIDTAIANSFENVDRISFSNAGTLNLQPRLGAKLYNQNLSVHKTQSVYFRIKSGIDEMLLDNTSCDQLPAIVTIPKRSGAVVGLTVINTEDSNSIEVQNLPHGSLGYNLVRRNITNSEKEFKIVRNLSEEATAKEGTHLDMTENRPVFDRTLRLITFFDDDMTEENVYEYKLLYYDDNCESSLSISSAIEIYEKRRNILEVELIDVETGEDSESAAEAENSMLTYVFKAYANESEIDKIFKSIDRNTYELFSKEFGEIKDSIKKFVSCIVYLQNRDTSDKIEIGRFTPNNETSEFSVDIEIPNIYDEYSVIVEPRYATPTFIVDNIVEKIDLLPFNDFGMPISGELRNLKSIRASRRTATLDGTFISKIGSKYTSRGVKFLGTIIDPISKYNKERNDFYYDGRTGDKKIFPVRTTGYRNLIGELSLLGYDDITTADIDKNGLKNTKGIILKMSAKNDDYVDFHAVYTKSNGTINFQGLINPDSSSNKNNYKFYADLGGEIGYVEIYTVTVKKDGSINGPKLLTRALCNKNNVRIF